jgi:Nucleotidyl transferase AbiEii toxin, Type IV TA system
VIARYPGPEQLEDYATRFELPLADVIRDIARLAGIAHLRSAGFLNEDCVLVGGMALRLRGSSRFTVFDTDTSLRSGNLDEKALASGLTVTTDDLEIEPAEADYWEFRTKLTIAQPIRYRAYFPAALSPVRDRFSFTVNRRGLNLGAEWFDLRTEYPGLVFSEPVSVPVMHLTEQTAEKIVAWAAASLAKHYLDLGWIAMSSGDELDGAELRRQCEVKLEAGREAFPRAYEALPDMQSLHRALVDPKGYFGPLNQERDLKSKGIRFTGARMTLEEAREYAITRLAPLLVDGP